MKILQINCVYQIGSTGKLMGMIHRRLVDDGEMAVICYGRGVLAHELHVYKTASNLYAKFQNFYSRLSGVMYGGCFFSTNKLLRVLKREKPDIVHLHCINGYFVNIYRLIEWLKLHEIPTVLTLHAEFMYTANCDYSLDCDRWLVGCGKCPRLREATKSYFLDRTARSFRRMNNAFDNFHDNLRIVSVSPWLAERAQASPILANKQHICILNGVDTDVFYRQAAKVYKEKYCPSGEKMIFHVTAHFSDDPRDIKGGHWLLRLSERMIGQPVRFVVAGDVWTQRSVPDNVILLGKVQNQKELAMLYSAADVTLLLSKKETFSMVVAESLCCGTPVVGFEAGAPEMITIADYSDFYEQGDIAGLEQGVKKWLRAEPDKTAISNRAIDKYSAKKMVDSYLDVYRGVFNESGKK